MTRRIVLLRAINVGGTAKLPMADLRQLAGELGATNSTTYIASGNLLIDLDSDPSVFDRALEKAIETRFGFFREVISRSPEQVQAALDAHPFEIVEPKFSYVTFLADTPAPAAISAAESLETGDDRWRVIGNDLHIRYAHGAGQPGIKTEALGKALAVAGTARNINTVKKLIELA